MVAESSIGALAPGRGVHRPCLHPESPPSQCVDFLAIFSSSSCHRVWSGADPLPSTYPAACPSLSFLAPYGLSTSSYALYIFYLCTRPVLDFIHQRHLLFPASPLALVPLPVCPILHHHHLRSHRVGLRHTIPPPLLRHSLRSPSPQFHCTLQPNFIVHSDPICNTYNNPTLSTFRQQHLE